jgi:hypothetical protein
MAKACAVCRAFRLVMIALEIVAVLVVLSVSLTIALALRGEVVAAILSAIVMAWLIVGLNFLWGLSAVGALEVDRVHGNNYALGSLGPSDFERPYPDRDTSDRVRRV